MSRTFRTLAILSVLLGVCVSAGAASGAGALQATLERLAGEHRICGAVVAVIEHRALGAVYTASGCQPPLRLTPESTFEAASLGKPVFAYAVLKMAERGDLALDTPLTHYLLSPYVHQQSPYGTVPAANSGQHSDPRLNEVTARMVLTHTAGLPNWSKNPIAFGSNPGARWQYSGAGYVLLQRAIEAISGKPLDEVMAAQVFVPTSMKHSDYVWSPRIAADMVPQLRDNGARVQSKPFTSPIAATSLYTSASDFGRFMAVLLSDAPQLRQTADAPVLADANLGLSWGLGWGIEREKNDLFIWHWGNNPGYRAFAVASVQTGDGFVLLTDSDDGLALAAPIAALVVPGAHRMFRFPMLNPSFNCKMFGRCN